MVQYFQDREDPDFTIDFSYNTRLGEKLAVFRRGEQKIYINDAKALQRDWIAHVSTSNQLLANNLDVYFTSFTCK